MAAVTGTLLDCGLGRLAGLAPELVFTIDSPALYAAGIYATEPVVVVPTTAATWSAELADNETMSEPHFYRLQVRWLDAAGNFVKVDFPDWRIFVPIAGGVLPDLIANYSPNPFMLFYQATEPDPWPVGSVWLDTSVDTPTSGDLNRRKA